MVGGALHLTHPRRRRYIDALREQTRKLSEAIHLDDLTPLRVLGAGSYGTVSLMRHVVTGAT